MIRIFAFLGHRLLFIVPQLFGILLVSFVLIKTVPGDPAVLMLGPMASAESVANYVQAWLGSFASPAVLAFSGRSGAW